MIKTPISSLHLAWERNARMQKLRSNPANDAYVFFSLPLHLTFTFLRLTSTMLHLIRIQESAHAPYQVLISNTWPELVVVHLAFKERYKSYMPQL